MLPTLTKRMMQAFSLLIPVSLFFLSCQKEISGDTNITTDLPSDLSVKVSSSVSGFVTDENDLPVKNAVVTFGAYNTTTDKYGYFEARNVQVVQNAAFVTVSKPGYFKGIKTFIAKSGKKAVFRIRLIPKTNSGTVDGSTGGAVTLSNGLSVSFPANAIVNASNNSPYTGTVKVAAYYINPATADLGLIMPGDLRGINSGGQIKLLKSFGMAAVELTGASGELLQIASGKTATLTMPIPSTLGADAPASVPLWYFDETKGLWKEEGTATKNGSNYVGTVSHFSYWNCDFPFPEAVQFDCTIVNSAGMPVPGAFVSITYSNSQYTGCHGITDSNGYISGAIPANSQLKLKVMDFTCFGGEIYSQDFTTTNVNISLGTITLPPTFTATISGSLLNCTNQPVTDGYVLVHAGTFYYRYNVSGTNTFTLPSLFCSTMTVSVTGGDITASQEGNPVNLTLIAGNNNIGNLVACGTATNQFIDYTIDGVAYSITPPASLVHMQDSLSSNVMRIAGYLVNTYIDLRINTTGIAAGSSQNLNAFTSDATGQTTIPSPITVNITEYGAVGQFLAGNFSGTVTSVGPPSSTHTVSCSFRLRRNY